MNFLLIHVPLKLIRIIFLCFCIFCRSCVLDYLHGNFLSASSKLDGMLDKAEYVQLLFDNAHFGRCSYSAISYECRFLKFNIQSALIG